MNKVVLDSTVLLSAFLTKEGLSAQLLHKAAAGAFTMCLAKEILRETERVLLMYERIRKNYIYTDDAVRQFIQGLRLIATIVTDLPTLQVVRDPNDDMIIACAVRAKASHIVTRDQDLLVLNNYHHTEIVTPEAFMVSLRR